MSPLRPWRRLAAALAILAILAAPATGRAMTFERLGGKACPAAACILAAGDIEADTAAQFGAFLRQENIPPGSVVFLDSPGGDLVQGLALGGLIRGARLSTRVDADATGPTAGGGQCASACAYSFLGGVSRSVGKRGRVGVHQMLGRTGQLSSGDSQELVALIAVHLKRYGGTLDLLKPPCEPRRNAFTGSRRRSSNGLAWSRPRRPSRRGRRATPPPRRAERLPARIIQPAGASPGPASRARNHRALAAGLGAALAAAAAPAAGWAVEAATASASASATIVEPVGIAMDSALRLPTSLGGRNIVSTESAAYAVQVGDGRSFSLEAPARLTLRAADGSSAIEVELTSRKTLERGALGATARVEIAASAALPAGAPPGRYIGAYETTVSYE